MAKTHRGYVFGTFLSSCVALVLLIVACATNVWIDSKLLPLQGTLESSSANYGLFRGTFTKRITNLNSVTPTIAVVCDFGENVCAWSCETSSENRKKELATLLDGIVDGTSLCGTSQSNSDLPSPLSNITSVAGTDSLKGFMNAGLYLSTVMALMLALLATTAAALLAVLNSASNPTRTWLAVESLYYWNGAAAFLDLLCLILWGSHYAVALKDSIGLNEVISGVFTSNDQASLGWSYWLVLVALVISAANIAGLLWRDYLIWKEPPPPTWNPEKEAADGTLILY